MFRCKHSFRRRSPEITTKLADKLELVPSGRKILCISGYGENNKNIQELPTTVVYLQTAQEIIPMDVLIVPEIAVPLKTYLKGMKHLPVLKLAHPLMDDGYFEITMLIGADYYWSIVQDSVNRGDGPTAVQSKNGYLLSGPVAGYNQKSHTPLMMNILASHTQEEVDLEKFWKAESLGIERTESDRYSDIYLADY